jgi:hypothetical protein
MLDTNLLKEITRTLFRTVPVLLCFSCMLSVPVIRKDSAPYVDIEPNETVLLNIKDRGGMFDTAFLFSSVVEAQEARYGNAPYFLHRNLGETTVTLMIESFTWEAREDDRTSAKRNEEYESWNSSKSEEEKSDPEMWTTSYIIGIFDFNYQGTVSMLDASGNSFSEPISGSYSEEIIKEHYMKNTRTAGGAILQNVINTIAHGISFEGAKSDLAGGELSPKVFKSVYRNVARETVSILSNYFPRFVTYDTQLLNINRDIDKRLVTFNRNAGLPGMVRFLEGYVQVLQGDEKARAAWNLYLIHQATGDGDKAAEYKALFDELPKSDKTVKQVDRLRQ